MDYKNQLLEKLNSKSARIGIVGLGYVGLPLALEFSANSFNVTGFDIDESKIPVINSGNSYIKHIKSERVKKAVDAGFFKATSDFSCLTGCDCVIICVPTPLNEHREPDISFIENSGRIIAKYLRQGQLVTLESSTWPGTTEEVLLPMFEDALISQGNGDKKMTAGVDFFLAFSPEREDPGNPDFNTGTIPKLVGGHTEACKETACRMYENAVSKVVPVNSTKVAEAAKLLENIYRSVNIALVNELKMVFDRMGIDVWEVIEAAKSKPFGFQAFYPGPGLGGHCIPIDPFYLTWKAREYEINTRFIELAGEINTNQPYYVIERSIEALNGVKKSINGSKVLILGMSYKKDIDDMRESPSLRLIELFMDRGAEVNYNDPFFPKLFKTRKYNYNLQSVELTADNLQQYDLVVLSTDHSQYDYKFIAGHASLIIDTRNAFGKRGLGSSKIVKA